MENKIFICLSNKKVKIIDYDFKRIIFDFSEITENNIFNTDYYYKCIQLSSGLYAISDNNISIWSKKNNFYIKIKNINVNSSIYDLQLIDKDNFMCTSSSNKNLIIYDIKTYLTLKIIKNIDFRGENNTLLKVNNNFILINCYKGIGIFDIKCYQIIHYTQEYFTQLNIKITFDSCNKI